MTSLTCCDPPVQTIATEIGISRPMVWRWQQRFAEQGVEGLLRDKTRKPGKPPILPSALPVHLLYAHNRQLSPRVPVFIDWVAEQYRFGAGSR